MKEIWKKLKGYEDRYLISNHGRIISLFRKGKKQKRILKPGFDSYHYPIVTLYGHNKRQTKTIHRLVALTFISNDDLSLTVNHIDGNKQNNKVTNLEWCSSKKNTQHAFKIGLMKNYGENHSLTNFLNKDILNIKNLYKNNQLSYQKIANIYNVHKTTIARIITNKTWKHINV